MQALQYSRPGKLEIIELDKPNPRPNDLLVKVAYSGICGTDLHILKEEAPSSHKVFLGHEFAGIVDQVGTRIKTFKIGDRVAVNPNNFCGNCNYCKNGQVHFCINIKPIGINKNGGWADFCLVPQNQVSKIPDTIGLDWAALAEPLSCIIHGWDKIQPVKSNESICILGGGLIGLLWAIVLRHFGLIRILISEPNDFRTNQARNLGFEAINPKDLRGKILNGREKFDVIIDCSGNVAAIEEAFDWFNPLGKFLLFGICPEDSNISIQPFKIFQNELRIIGSVINPFTFERAIELMAQINQPLEKLGIVYFPLSDYNSAIETAKVGHATKVIFKIRREES